MGTVVVLGSLITDLVARAPRLPLAGESLIGDDFAIFEGGKGINQAIAAARLGAKVTLVGRVGTDTFGDAFFPILTREGINSKYVERDTSIGTGVSILIIATNTGQNMIVVNQRANLAVTAESVEAALHAVQAERKETVSGVVFLAQCETSKISFVRGLQLARTLGMTTILNAAPIPREPLEDDLFPLIDILVVNEIEASSLAQVIVDSQEAARAAAESLLLRGPKHVVITLGAQGCLWSTYEEGGEASVAPREGKEPIHQMLPPFMVKAVDATASGDAFCGALAASLAEGMPMLSALQRANAAGAVTVTRPGAIAALPTAAEVEALL